MVYTTLSCFASFRCLAGACPDTCCAGWEIDLDEETLARYRTLPGPLGERIREKIKTEDGYTFFALEQGRCPFLTREKLCRLILELGEEALSVTCREHPRFWEEYGDLQETVLAISCPEAARLLLAEPVHITVRETEEPAADDWALDQALLQLLLRERETMFALARADQPMEERFARLENQAENLQNRLDLEQHREDVIETRVFRQETPETEDWKRQRPWGGLPFLRAMTGMEFTDGRLPELLERTLAHPPAMEQVAAAYEAHPMEAENLLVYFLYRYVLRAVWDGALLPKVLLCTHAVEAIFTLSAGLEGDFKEHLTQAAILVSREVEHSPENLELLYGVLCGESREYA